MCSIYADDQWFVVSPSPGVQCRYISAALDQGWANNGPAGRIRPVSLFFQARGGVLAFFIEHVMTRKFLCRCYNVSEFIP